MLREVVKQVQGSRINGASGISFVRVLDRTTAVDFDPVIKLGTWPFRKLMEDQLKVFEDKKV